MDHYRMNRGGCRPTPSGSCQQPGRCMSRQASAYSAGGSCSEALQYLDRTLPVAMGYVPCQTWGKTFELGKAFQMGTIFPDLCKPFCGKGGAGCR